MKQITQVELTRIVSLRASQKVLAEELARLEQAVLAALSKSAKSEEGTLVPARVVSTFRDIKWRKICERHLGKEQTDRIYKSRPIKEKKPHLKITVR